MKRFIQYTAVLIALTFAASCNQIEDLDTNNGLICFAPQSVETKAMVTSVNLTGQAFKVIDLMGTTRYIDDAITFDQDNNAWVFASGDTYLWKDGSHKFFGYTRGDDPDQPGIIGTLSGTTLTIPETKLSTSENQTDLLYSSIVSTTAEDWKAAASGHTTQTPVPLEFHHLLSAISVTVENCTGGPLTVNSVTVTLPNKTSATVDFGVTTTDHPTVEVVTPLTTVGAFHTYTPTADNATLADQAIIDVLTGTLLATSDAKATPFMIWPQTLAKDAATISIQIDGESNPRTVSILKDTKWEAGKVNAYNLMIYPETITLNFIVQPWYKKTIDVDTDFGSINMSNVTWMNFKVMVNGEEKNTLDNARMSVYMYAGESEQAYNGYYPAQGYFTVNYPKSGKYRIGLIPAYGDSQGQYFDEDAYEIWIYDSDNESWYEHNQEEGEVITINTVYFQVRAASGQDGYQHKAQINIWFLPDDPDDPNDGNEWISAYSEVRATYSLIIPASN